MDLAIDPGASTGWALFDRGTLVDCGACAPGSRTWTVTRCIAEKPMVYPREPVDPNNLITLAVSLGIVLGPLVLAGVQITYITPREWKGQTPKPVHHPRIVAKLSPPELALYRARIGPLGAKARTDLTDAVGLGQYAILHGLWH